MGIATTGIGEPTPPGAKGPVYVGRFAPTPSGDLHLGSLFTAAASYLDARAHGGKWLVRLDDVDAPRVVPGAAERMLRTLAAFGFEWDGPVVHQSTRMERYRCALETLRSDGLTFACSCSRSELADEERYPGTCRNGAKAGRATGLRLRVAPGYVGFEDRVQGRFRQDVAACVGDFTLQRRDGLPAYVLAVVLDDADAGVTHVARGADLLDNTPRQILLQRLLDLPPVSYAHVPLLVEADGRKLSKSQRSLTVEAGGAASPLRHVFALLGLQPPWELERAPPNEAWAWAIDRFNIHSVPARLSLGLE